LPQLRNIKLQQLAARYPDMSFELAQAQHVEGTISEFKFKSLPDVKIEDYKKTLDALPEPWVKDKRFSIHGYATHKHTVNPTGLDEEELAAHTSPLEAQKLS
jgi:hypothetical protein